jgi:pimeloyl-ACP methyl ester carboxylesterase
MPFMPFSILGMWLRGLLAIALLGLGIFLLREWYERATTVYEPVAAVDAEPKLGGAPELGRTRRVGLSEWRPGLDATTAMLAGGLALVGLSLGGGSLLYPLMRRRGTDEPEAERGGRVERLRRPDGSELHVELYGPADGPTVVLTHGWGANATEWYYLKQQLGDRFRLIAWDLPGLGLSRRPDNNEFSLEKLARDLDVVVELARGAPVVLLGHSIGGMIGLTYCRLFPESLGRKVSGLVLVHTTPTNPVCTTRNAGLYTALQKPVIEPLLHLTIWLSPLVWAMNWMSYLNGSAHRSTEKESFSGNETRGQLNFAASFMPHASPAVLARGMFGMLAYDASATLKTIDVPVLVVPGDLDATCTPEASAWMDRDLPKSRLEALSPAKHMGLLEHNDRFSKLVGDFVSSCSPSGRPGVASRSA